MNLPAWLAHIATVHPRDIELGLERVRRVAKNMGLERPAPFVFTVAGTNGKGSTLAAIDAILLNSSLRTGSYQSPHLHRFNERIRLSGTECDDESLCAALAKVDHAREGISLSYFEFATLAALHVFAQERLDAIILEVGLGGRLDAVNIVDADVALITNIELDHQHWLGDSREEIGAEKAGILRRGTPLVYGEEQPPASVLARAEQLDAPVFCREREYGASDEAGAWCWWGSGGDGAFRLENLARPKLPLPAMAAALQAVQLADLRVTENGIRTAQHQASLPGRLEQCRDRVGGTAVLLDVAHNPAAARQLAETIAELRAGFGPRCKVAAVIALLADKDIEGMAAALSAQVDVWYISEFEDTRNAPASVLYSRLRHCLPDAEIILAGDVAHAYREAAGSGSDLVVVTGSFHTVAAARPFTTAGAR